jgi:hypothetical protein
VSSTEHEWIDTSSRSGIVLNMVWMTI